MSELSAYNIAPSVGQAHSQTPTCRLGQCFRCQYSWHSTDSLDSKKYIPYTALNMPDRQWPSRRTTQHPVWLSTDLRDGNQSLPQPMTIDEKLTFFRHLVKTGFEEIEVAYPSASDTEFNFVRRLIEDNEIPDNVWIQVCRSSHLANHVLIRTCSDHDACSP